MILQSEISNEGMVLIMEKLHTYVPTVSTPIELECPKSDEPTTMILERWGPAHSSKSKKFKAYS